MEESTRRKAPAWLLVALFPWLLACGYVCDKTKAFCGESEDDGDPVLAEMTMTASSSDAAGERPASESYGFTAVAACDHDPDKGLLRVQYPGEHQHLLLEVRDFTLGAKTYACAQALNNNDEAAHVGDLYESCMVEIKTPNPQGQGADTYAMHRATTAVKRFSYDGACTFQLSADGQRLEGAFACTHMAQVMLAGLPRNPVATDKIHADRLATFEGHLTCDLRTTALTGIKPTPTPPPPPKAVIRLTASNGTTAQAELDSAPTCTASTESGLFRAVFANAKGPGLEVEIRNFAGDGSSSLCRQAPGNADGLGTLTELYEGCMIEVKTASGAAGSLNAYSMHRRSAAVKRFAYDDTCAVTVTEADGDVKGTVDCKKLAETALNGLPRNPVATDQIHPDVTADLTAEFKCRLTRL